jgi:putative ABC transport system permease protein
LAFFIALPLGAFLAFGSTQYMLNIFNIDYEQFQFSTNALLWQAAAALIVPLLVGLWPVFKGAAITVREAIATYGLGADFGSSRLDRVIEHVGGKFLSAPYAISLGNMFRRKGRLLLTQAVLVVAGVTFLMVSSVSSSMTATVDDIVDHHRYDFFIQFEGNERVDQVLRIAGNQAGVEHAEAWFSTSASILQQGQRLKDAGIGAELIGIPNGSDFFTPPRLITGRWLLPKDGRAIVLHVDVANDNNIRVGDTITLDLGPLGDDDWQVVGLYKPVFSDVAEIYSIYTNLDAIFEATHKQNQAGQILVRTQTHEPEAVDAIVASLKSTLESQGIDLSASKTINEIYQEANSQFQIVLSMLLLLAVIMALVGGIGLMGALSIAVVERTREIGVLRAVGARSRTILGMLVMEGVFQGVLSWAVAVPLSLLAAPWLSDMVGQVMLGGKLVFRFDPAALVIWLGLVIIISTLASILPARSAIRVSVQESLAYQ